MADGTLTHSKKLSLTLGERRDVVALGYSQTRGRLLEAAHEFQDIVAELEWRVRDYLTLCKSGRASDRVIAAAESVIHQRNREGMRLDAEIMALEARARDFAAWIDRQPRPAAADPAATPDLLALLFARMQQSGLNDAATAAWPTLAAVALCIHQPRPHRKTGELAARFNHLGDI